MNKTTATSNTSLKKSIPVITLQLDQDVTQKFTALFQSRFEVETKTGEPLLTFLEKIPGFTPEYIEEEVQTILLNGEPVDDVYTPLTESGAVIALSTVVPGLGVMGAMFRKKSIHSSSDFLNHNNSETKTTEKKITISLKLFNYIARARGAEILRKGVRIRTAAILTFFQTRPWLLEQIKAVTINDISTHDTDELVQELNNAEHCHFALTD